MKIGDRQKQFPPMVAKLILFAYEQGYQLTFGDAYRDPRVFGNCGEKEGYGEPYSNHKLRLAVDFNLFKNGHWLTQDSDFDFLHDYWESIGGAARIPGDGNHFSLDWQGRR